MYSGHKSRRTTGVGRTWSGFAISVIEDADAGSPSIESLRVAQRVIPRHGGEASLATVEIVGHMVGLYAVEPLRRLDGDEPLSLSKLVLSATGTSVMPVSSTASWTTSMKES